MAAALNSKHQWAVESGELIGTEALCLALSQTHPSDSLSVADFVVEGNSVAPEMDPTGQFAQSFAGRRIYQLVPVQRDAGREKVLPTSDRFELGPNVCSQSLRRCCLQRPAGSAPELVQLSQGAPQPVLVGMRGLALEQRLGQHVARGGRSSGGPRPPEARPRSPARTRSSCAAARPRAAGACGARPARPAANPSVAYSRTRS